MSKLITTAYFILIKFTLNIVKPDAVAQKPHIYGISQCCKALLHLQSCITPADV